MRVRVPPCSFSCGAVPSARDDGLSAEAGVPPQGSSLIAAAIAVVVLLLCLGFGATLAGLLLLAAAGGALAWLSLRQIGGQTGDVLGAFEQAGEVADPADRRRRL